MSTDIQGKGSPSELLQERAALHGALLSASARLAEAQDPDAILRCACDILVTVSPRIRLAWMYLGETNDGAVRPSYAVGAARACDRESRLRRCLRVRGAWLFSSWHAFSGTSVLGRGRLDHRNWLHPTALLRWVWRGM